MRRDGSRWLHGLALGLLILVALGEVGPYLWMVSTSLKSLPEILARPGALLPESLRWGNYAEVWAQAPFLRYLGNSLLVTLSIALCQAVVACLAGYAFARLRFPGRDLLFYLVLACLMIPAQVRFVSVYVLLDSVGLLNGYLAQILPWSVSPLGIFLMRQAFLAVPRDVTDAARVDGAGTLRIIAQIMVPICRPTLVAFLLFSFVFHWNDYFWPLVVTFDEAVRPLPLGVALLREQGTGLRWHLIMAGNVILVAPVLAVFALAQRQIVKAFVAGSGR